MVVIVLLGVAFAAPRTPPRLWANVGFSVSGVARLDLATNGLGALRA
jgi:hypothetical protein